MSSIDDSSSAILLQTQTRHVLLLSLIHIFYPPDREVLRGINLSFYPGAKIGVIGANGSGKSSLLRIMAGLDDGFSGEARLTPGFSVGYLSQEPQLDPTKDVVGNVADGIAEPVSYTHLDVYKRQVREPNRLVIPRSSKRMNVHRTHDKDPGFHNPGLCHTVCLSLIHI